MSIVVIRYSILLVAILFFPAVSEAAVLRAGVARVEITDREAGPVHDPSYVKALVLKSDERVAVLITVDAVAIGEIGRIGNEYLPQVRARLQKELGIAPENVLVNASHCHSVVRKDTDALTVQAVTEAWHALVPVTVGAGVRQEARISENRRLKMKDGSEVDMRRAYSLPRDEDVAGVGPIDPTVAVVRIDREDGRPLAVVYHFACHPIMNPPRLGNSADFPGTASKVIEESLGNGALALFVQGCCGDINPVRYKDVGRPPNAEPLGNMLGLSVMQAWKKIAPQAKAAIRVDNVVIPLPRGTDLEHRIGAIEAEQTKLLRALKPTDIDFKSFVPLYLQHKLSPEFPSLPAQAYLHDRALGRDELDKLDAANRKSIDAYLENIRTMERLTRLNVNLALLRKHLAQNQAAGQAPLQVEIAGLRVGEFRLVAFPGELTVEIGLNIKRRAAAPFTAVSGYTNGYIYYLPTVQQRGNTGYAQEDCDCLVAPEWQQLFETKALEMLKKL